MYALLTSDGPKVAEGTIGEQKRAQVEQDKGNYKQLISPPPSFIRFYYTNECSRMSVESVRIN